MRNQPGAGVRRRAQCSEVSPDATKASPAADDDPCYLGASDFDTILAESVWGARKLGSPQKSGRAGRRFGAYGLAERQEARAGWTGISGGRAGDRVPCRAVCS